MWNGVVTNLGLSLLEQWAAGSETLYIDKATAGSGTVAQSNMRGSTYVQGEVGDVSIVASIPVTGGTQYRIQVSANPDAAYIMHQIGIWAHLGASGGTTLLALYQDEDGVSVPLEADDPGFGFTLYAVVSMSNQGSVSVNFDGGAYVTRDDFSSALAGYAKTVNGNGPNSDGNVTLPTDTTPTQNSTNYVTSGGVYTGLAGKVDNQEICWNDIDNDLNNLESTGFYRIKGSGDTLNAPFSNPGHVLVMSGANYTLQLATRSNTTSIKELWMRKKNGSVDPAVWSDWWPVDYNAQQAIGIVATGTTAPQAITAGQYVIWQGSLYTAKSNIASGATLSTSDLTAVSGGGLNSVLNKINALTAETTINYGSRSSVKYFKRGNIVQVRTLFYMSDLSAIDAWSTSGTLVTMPAGFRPAVNIQVRGIVDRAPDEGACMLIGSTGEVSIVTRYNPFSTSGDAIQASFVYATSY